MAPAGAWARLRSALVRLAGVFDCPAGPSSAWARPVDDFVSPAGAFSPSAIARAWSVDVFDTPAGSSPFSIGVSPSTFGDSRSSAPSVAAVGAFARGSGVVPPPSVIPCLGLAARRSSLSGLSLSCCGCCRVLPGCYARRLAPLSGLVGFTSSGFKPLSPFGVLTPLARDFHLRYPCGLVFLAVRYS